MHVGAGTVSEGVVRLEELGKKGAGLQGPCGLERSRDVNNLVMYLGAKGLGFRMPGLRSNSNLAVHYYARMALKCWYLGGMWPEYGRSAILLPEKPPTTGTGRTGAGLAWLSNLKEYTVQYERLIQVKDMPENRLRKWRPKRSATDFLREQMMTGDSLPASILCRSGRDLDHLRMQYQKARDWEAAEAVRLAELKEKEERKKAQEEAARQKPLRAAQARSYDDICREAAGIMEKTGDYEQVSTAYRNAGGGGFFPIVKTSWPPGGNDGPDEAAVLRLEKILPELVERSREAARPEKRGQGPRDGHGGAFAHGGTIGKQGEAQRCL